MDLLTGFLERANRDTRKDSTRKSYDADVRAFEKWAASAGLTAPIGRPVPAAWVAAWAEAMVNAGMAPATIERRVRGLGSHHRVAGYPDPTAFDKMVASCSPDEDLCPVDAVTDWLEMAGIETGPAFRGITRHNTVRSSAISTRAVGDIIKASAKDAGVQGVPQAIIKQYGRWKTDASAARYMDSVGSESALAATSAVIGRCLLWPLPCRPGRVHRRGRRAACRRL